MPGGEYEKHKIAVMGDKGVGKMSLIIRHIQNVFIDVYDQYLDEEQMGEEIDDLYCMNTFFKVRNEEDESHNNLFIGNADAILLVYSICDRESFDKINEFHKRVKRIRNNENVPMILVQNKCDLECERAISVDEGKALALKFGIPFMQTSAKLKVNIPDCFHRLIRMIRNTNEPLVKVKKSGGCNMQ